MFGFASKRDLIKDSYSSPLGAAVVHNNSPLVRYLASKGVDLEEVAGLPAKSPAGAAIMAEAEEGFYALLDCGLNLSARFELNERGERYPTDQSFGLGLWMLTIGRLPLKRPWRYAGGC
jgi:hypothetical protein